jgi:hypothetical protein
MKKFSLMGSDMVIVMAIVTAIVTLSSCNTKPDGPTDAAKSETKDTLVYPFTATYSSDITIPSNPGIALKVLQVWKSFETGQIQAMKPFFADTVSYDDASGMHFHGKSSDLLAFAAKDIADLDSLRFDISRWESAHVNDKNEDWVNIWSTERRYHKNVRADTFFIQENWKVKDGKVVYFDQYTKK